jgi:hypothetical protein
MNFPWYKNVTGEQQRVFTPQGHSITVPVGKYVLGNWWERYRSQLTLAEAGNERDVVWYPSNPFENVRDNTEYYALLTRLRQGEKIDWEPPKFEKASGAPAPIPVKVERPNVEDFSKEELGKLQFNDLKQLAKMWLIKVSPKLKKEELIEAILEAQKKG